MIHAETLKEFGEGWVTEPMKVQDWMLDEYSFTRRIPVEQWSASKGHYVRIVDHCTESLLKALTPQDGKLRERPVKQLSWA